MAFDPVSIALDIGGKLIDRLWPDPTEAAKARLELLKMQQQGDLAVITGQMEINKAEAGSQHLFVAGWRPCIGWICGAGLAYAAILEPVIRLLATLGGYTGSFPVIDTTLTMQILIGMLGLGGLRSLDKYNGVAAK